MFGEGTLALGGLRLVEPTPRREVWPSNPTNQYAEFVSNYSAEDRCFYLAVVSSESLRPPQEPSAGQVK